MSGGHLCSAEAPTEAAAETSVPSRNGILQFFKYTENKMTGTKIKWECTVNDNTGGLPVIIVAAGSSTRMGTNKQFLEIGSIPVIARTLMAFQNCEAISRIILVTRAEDIFTLQTMASNYGITKLTDILCGGDNRQQSVLNGFERLSKDEKSVLIHDGARPLVSNRVICAVAEKLENCQAVTCAVKVKDTIKQVDKDGKVVKTLLRDSLVSVQTPQGVKVDEYLSAVKEIKDISLLTDDMSVMETAGYTVYTVEGDYKNIKITTPEDIPAAIAFLEDEE